MSASETVLLFFFSVISTIGILFNVAVVLVILRTSSLRTPMNYLLLNVAISDIMISVFVLPRHVFFDVFEHTEGLRGEFLCKLITGGVFIWIGVTAEGYTLITIAVERYVAIIYPHSISSRITTRKLKWIVPLCWGINTAVNSPTLVSLSYVKERDFCIELWPHWFEPKAYVAFVFVVGVSSVVAMFVLYTFVVCRLWRRHDTIEVPQNARLRMRQRVTKMLVVITVLHAMCRLPNYIFYLLSYVSPGAIYGSLVYNLTVLFILTNSALHPFLLCLHLSTFRQGLRRLLGCRASSLVEPVNLLESTVQFNVGRVNYVS